jgi:hypothetical protein
MVMFEGCFGVCGRDLVNLNHGSCYAEPTLGTGENIPGLSGLTMVPESSFIVSVSIDYQDCLSKRCARAQSFVANKCVLDCDPTTTTKDATAKTYGQITDL